MRCGNAESGYIVRWGAGVKEIVKKSIEISKDIKDNAKRVHGKSLKKLGVDEPVKTMEWTLYIE